MSGRITVELTEFEARQAHEALDLVLADEALFKALFVGAQREAIRRVLAKLAATPDGTTDPDHTTRET